ncbi:hypothetical protein PAAG_11296 [Paracoccidioides lutzii Pb01]|uniref:Uncharacterized protein n=1 Tax=Paracoccidioides lutzii (strain ATCC MYA-826 / Pb01) TaxID=502779 RepID=A0A0A2V275_PARBA|nr:hypothetical protein PAAG_11296 [Paracoccidioides lutzii Pb01]KGQ01906.1 hypothetical protein PAAG_11296 [Paracoccidioides lutzii Pb01]
MILGVATALLVVTVVGGLGLGEEVRVEGIRDVACHQSRISSRKMACLPFLVINIYRFDEYPSYSIKYCARRVRMSPQHTLELATFVSTFLGLCNLLNWSTAFSSTNASSIFSGKEGVIQALNIVMGHYPKRAEDISNIGSKNHFLVGLPDAEKLSLTAGLEAL